jgi:transposase-like protein
VRPVYRKYSDETKAAVVAALLAGQSVNSVAKEYNIPKGTVSGWKNGKGLGGREKATQKAERIGELVASYLATNLEALEVQAEAFKDQKWLAKQTASDAAVLHGVMTDKAVRLLEALSNAAANNATED